MLVIGTVLAPLDSSIVNIALPSIASEFGQRLAAVSWVSAAYLLTTASLLLPMGRLGDVWGLRKLYSGGLAVFGVGSIACAMSGSLSLLIASRVLQAVGASMLFAAGPALVTRTFPPNRRGWALGYISLSVSLGLTLGPALGGVLVGAFGWPAIFLINVPLAGITAFIAWRLLPDECPEGQRFDFLGALLAGSALLLLLIGLGEAERYDPLSLNVAAPVLGAFALFGLFAAWERRATSPMVDLRIFRSRSFSAGISAAMFAYLSLFAVTFTMPFYLLRIKGLDAAAAGIVLTATPLAMAALAPLAGRTSDRIGSRGLATAGLLVLAGGLLAASLLTAESTLWQVALTLFVVGAGMAVFQTPNTAAILRATPRESAGVGSAFVSEARNVGMAIGIALTAAIVGASVGGSGLPAGDAPLSPETAQAFSEGMALALRVAAGVTAGAAALSWFGRDDDAVERLAGTH